MRKIPTIGLWAVLILSNIIWLWCYTALWTEAARAEGDLDQAHTLITRMLQEQTQ